MQSIITTVIYLLSILVPLVFTIINYELFEFPKFIILLSGSLVIAVAWAIHIYQTHDYRLWKKDSPASTKIIHWSILAILGTQLLSTIFSIHPYTSFWGYYSRFHQGLLTTICYSLIYFAAVKWLDKRSTLKLIKISVGTAFFVSIYAILEHFGIDKKFWIQDVQSRVFSTLGQPNWLAAYLIPNIFLTLYLALSNKNKKDIHPYIVFIALFVSLLFTKSRSGFLGFLFAFLTYVILLIRQFNFAKLKNEIIKISLLLILIVATLGSPYSPSLSSLLTPKPSVSTGISQGTVLENGGTESGDIRKIVWSGALKLITKYPILGTGPETFAYTYYWMRPNAHNMTSEWDFLYNKAHNEYLNIAAGSGVLGLIAYLSWHAGIFFLSLITTPRTKKVIQEQEDNLRMFYPVIGASIVGFTITNFFGFSVIPVYLLMVIVSTIPSTIGIESLKSTDKKVILSPISLIVILLPLIYTAQLFLADISYAKGKKYFDAGQLATAIPLLQSATKTRPGLDLYRSTLGEAYASAGQKEMALQELDINKKLNPYHLNYFKSRAKIYLTLATNDPTYHVQAAEELAAARTLAPSDPKLAYNLGLVYTRLNATDKAEQQFKDSIALKSNYAEPYYAITLLYEQTKQVDKIKPVLDNAKSNLATYSAQLKEKIDKYVK